MYHDEQTKVICRSTSFDRSHMGGHGVAETPKERTMKKTAALPVILALLIAAPALARTHQHRPTNPTAYGYVARTHQAPTYSNHVPWAPF